MKLEYNKDDPFFYFDAGRQHHKNKEYRLAWENWIMAHGLLQTNYQLTAANQILNLLLNANISPHNLSDKGRDLIFVVGMPRSGTTLVEQILITHPGIEGYGERREMVSILDDALIKFDLNLKINHFTYFQQVYRRGLTKERRRYHVDKMPRNFIGIPVIKAIFPECKIIHLRRERFPTCMSIYASHFGDFTPYAHRWETLNIFYDHYLLMMENFKHLTHEVIYEDLVTHFDETVQSIFEFIQMTPTGKEHLFYQNNVPVLTCSKDQVNKPLYQNANTQWDPYRQFICGESS